MISPKSDSSAGTPRKAKKGKSFSRLLSKYVPFLRVAKKHKKNGPSKGRIQKIKHRIAERKKLKKLHPHPKKDGLYRSAPARSAAAAPVATKAAPALQKKIDPGVIDDFKERIFLPAKEKTPAPPKASAERSVPLGNKVIAEQPKVIIQKDPRAGLGGFFRGLFAKHPSPAMPAAKVPVAASATPKTSALDMDSLLSSSTDTPKKEVPAPVATERSLPRQDLLDAQDAPQAGKAKRLSAAPAQAVSVAKEAPAKQSKAIVSVEKSVPAPQAPAAPAPSLPAPQELTFKHKQERKHSGMRELAGAIKYFGVGGQRQAIVQNLATMLNAGLPLIDAIKTLMAEARNKTVHSILQKILEAVENGSPLWRAMDDLDFFSPHAIALIRIGEEAGNLAENMEYLAQQQEKDAALKGKVKMAMIYPSIVMVLMFIIIMGLGMFVLPNLVKVLFSLNVPLPLVTRIVIWITNLFTTYGKVGVPAVTVGFLFMIAIFKFTSLKVVAQWAAFKIPGIGRLTKEATIARFGVILGGLLRAGVPLVDAIHSLAEVTPIVSYKNFYFKLLEHVTLGDSFAKSFQSIRGSESLLPVSVQQLVTTGEKSGALSEILLKVADIYEKKANSTAEKLPVILEPMLLLFIGGLVGTIAFSIIVPIYSIVGNISH